MQNRKQIAYFKLIMAMFLWAGVYHAAKFLVSDLDPYTCSAVRWTIASIVLGIILFNKEKSIKGFKQPAKNWPTIFGIGFIAIFLYNIIFFSAENLLTGNLVATITSFTPCIAVILSVIFFKEKINYITVFGIIIAFVGAVFAINSSDSGCGQLWCSNLLQNLSFGEFLAFLLCIGTALYSILLKRSANLGMDGLTITTLSSMVGAVLLLILAIFKGNLLAIFSLSLSSWGYLLYIALFGSALGYKWYSDGIKEIKVGQAVIFINAIPIATIIIGWVFFNIAVTHLFFMAAIMVVIGVLITNYSMLKR